MTWKLEASGTQCLFCDDVGIWFALSREEVARKWKEVVYSGKDARGEKFSCKWMWSRQKPLWEQGGERRWCVSWRRKLINLLPEKKRENPLWGGKPKKTPHLQHITVFSNHPSSCASLSTEDFVLIGGRNERSKFDRAKWKELLTKPTRCRR